MISSPYLLTLYPSSFQIRTIHIVVGVTVPLVLLVVLFILVVVICKRQFASRKATETSGNDNLSLPDSIIETR
jgi:hypothetical protein